MKLEEAMNTVMEPIAWEYRRGIIEQLDIEYIEETAEKQLSPEDHRIFAENDAAVTIYQDMIL